MSHVSFSLAFNFAVTAFMALNALEQDICFVRELNDGKTFAMDSVATLQKDVNMLKNEGTRVYPQKHLCNGDGSNDSESAGHDGSKVEGNHDSNDKQGLSEDSKTNSMMAPVSNCGLFTGRLCIQTSKPS